MKAFVEHLSGIIRAGENCDAYGKPYDCSIGYSSVDGKTAVLKGLQPDGKMTIAHARAAFKALEEIGLRATWERFK